jgi:hypothetical protein
LHQLSDWSIEKDAQFSFVQLPQIEFWSNLLQGWLRGAECGFVVVKFGKKFRFGGQ